MQIFNQINCRKLGNTLNIFENFFNNWIFIGILITTFVVQMLLVEFGGLAVRCQPLDWIQNLVCLAIGAGGLLWGLLIKLVIKPDQFAGLRIDDTPLTEEERAVNVMTVRKGST